MATTKKSPFAYLFPAMIDGERRGDPMTMTEAAGREGASKVNPHYDAGGGYEENCQTCMVAYEMRRRGYDVEARALGALGDVLSTGVEAAFVDPSTGKTPEVWYCKGGVPVYEGKATIDDLATSIDEMVKPGERWALVWNWSGYGGGHVVSLDKPKGGKLTLLDTQTGEKAVGPSRFWPDYFKGAYPFHDVYMFKTSGMALNSVFKGIMREAGQDSRVKRKPLTDGQIQALARGLCDWFAGKAVEEPSTWWSNEEPPTLCQG